MKTPVNQLRVPDLVLITRTALKQIEEEARQPRSQQPNLENETGGVLFGRRISLEDGQSAMLIIEQLGRAQMPSSTTLNLTQMSNMPIKNWTGSVTTILPATTSAHGTSTPQHIAATAWGM